MHVRWLLLVERRHAERLMHRDVLATGWSVTIVGVVAEATFVQVAKVRHDSIDTTEEALIFLNNEELVAATAETSNCLA